MQIDEQNQERWTFIVFTILALFSLSLASAVSVESSDGIPHSFYYPGAVLPFLFCVLIFIKLYGFALFMHI